MSSFQMIQLSLVTVPILMLSCTLILHHVQHFRCTRSRATDVADISSSMLQLLKNNTSRYLTCCSWTSVEDASFKFLPISFAFYLVFMIFLCGLILVQIILDPSPIAPPIFSIQSLQLQHTSDPSHSAIHYTLTYGIMLLSLWESLHAFYSFYTTFFAALHGYFVSDSEVIVKFTLFYAVTFSAVYSVSVHWFHWLFLLIVLFHVTFNTYCTLKFASILISSYQIFAEDSKRTFALMDDQLRNAYFMKKISIICCILQSIYLCAFVVSYSMGTVYYLPILWAISAFVYSLNFMRNRLVFHRLSVCVLPNAIKVHPNPIQTDPKLSSNMESHAGKPQNTPKSTHLTVPNALSIDIDAPNVEEAGATPKKNDKALQLLGLATPHSEDRSKKRAHGFHHSVTLSILPSFGDFLAQNSKQRSSIEEQPERMHKPQVINSKSNPTFYATKLKLNGQSLSNPILLTERVTPSASPLEHSAEGSDQCVVSFTPITIAINGEKPLVENKEDSATHHMDVKAANKKNRSSDIDMNVAVRSLNVLAQNGFYSKQNVNNIYQLKQYLQ